MTYASEVAADSPVDWWRLDETSGPMANQISSARDGVVVGSPLLGVLSRTGRAVQFVSSATSYISLPTATWSTSSQTQLSVECWFRMPTQDRSVEQFLVGGDTSTGQTFTAMRILTDGKLRAFMATSVSGGAGINSTAVVDDGNWHHAVMTISGGTMRLYLDGAQVTTGSAASVYPTQDWRVGQNPGFSLTSRAIVDEVAVYGTALSVARVSAHYAAADPVTTAAGLPRSRVLTVTPTVKVALTVALTRSRAFYGTATPTGQTQYVPIAVTASGTENVVSTGWTLSSDEEALGAIGVGAFWFKVTTPPRTVVSVTNAQSYTMYAYSLADPGQPPDVDNLALVDSGPVLDASSPGTLYIMVDVDVPAGTVPYVFTYTAPVVGSISLYVASGGGPSATTATVDVAPAALSANVSGTANVTSFDVMLDGEIILSDQHLESDGTWAGFIPVPAVAAGGYLLSAYGHGADVFSNDIVLTVLRTPAPGTPLPDDAPPRIPGALAGRWVFDDPATATSYSFPLNPVTSSSWNPPRNHSVESTTKPTSFVVYEGSMGAKSFTFGGVILDELMYQNLAAWSRLNRRVWLVDHNGIGWQVVPQHFDVRPRTNRLNPWIQDYEFTVLLLKGPVPAEVI